MNLASLDARNQDARARIKASAAALAEALALPALEEPTAIEWRQAAVGQMRELECVAALLEGVAAALLSEDVRYDNESNTEGSQGRSRYGR